MKSVVVIKPGLLFSPLGWAAQSVFDALAVNPALIRHVGEMTEARLHLVGLALSRNNSPNAAFLETVIAAPLDQAIRLVLDSQPAGLKRILNSLGYKALQPETYLLLGELVQDARLARLMSHAVHISEACLTALMGLPKEFRAAAFELMPTLLPGLGDGLRWLSNRLYGNDTALFEKLAKLKSLGQLKAAIQRTIDHLPLPETLPTARIGAASRIDHAAQLVSLGRSMRNCLAERIQEIEEGHLAAYLWKDDAIEAAILLARFGRLGWFIMDIKGPRNTSLRPDQQHHIEQAFLNERIHRSSAADALVECVGDRLGRGRGFSSITPMVEDDGPDQAGHSAAS